MKKLTLSFFLLGLFILTSFVSCGGSSNNINGADFNSVPDKAANARLYEYLEFDVDNISGNCPESVTEDLTLLSFDMASLENETKSFKGNCYDEDEEENEDLIEMTCKAGGEVLVVKASYEDSYEDCTATATDVIKLEVNANNEITGTMETIIYASKGCLIQGAEGKDVNCTVTATLKEYDIPSVVEGDNSLPPGNSPEQGTPEDSENPSTDNSNETIDGESPNTIQYKQIGEACNALAICDENLACVASKCRAICDESLNICSNNSHCLNGLCYTKEEIKTALDNFFDGWL